MVFYSYNHGISVMESIVGSCLWLGFFMCHSVSFMGYVDFIVHGVSIMGHGIKFMHHIVAFGVLLILLAIVFCSFVTVFLQFIILHSCAIWYFLSLVMLFLSSAIMFRFHGSCHSFEILFIGQNFVKKI